MSDTVQSTTTQNPVKLTKAQRSLLIFLSDETKQHQISSEGRTFVDGVRWGTYNSRTVKSLRKKNYIGVSFHPYSWVKITLYAITDAGRKAVSR